MVFMLVLPPSLQIKKAGQGVVWGGECASPLLIWSVHPPNALFNTACLN
jgi:hypothetical protein